MEAVLGAALEVLRRNAGSDRDRHAFTGAVAAVSRGGRLVMCEAVGNASARAGAPGMTSAAVFDVASLTKPIVTATAVLQLVERGELSLQDTVGRHLGELASVPIGHASLAHLLTHTSGAPWVPLYAAGAAQTDRLRAIAEAPLVARPGDHFEYSCTGYVLLGWIVERISGHGLDRVAADRIFGPLEMRDSRFLPLSVPLPSALWDRLVPTERRAECERGRAVEAAVGGRADVGREWRARHPDGAARGIVHDENAASLGGVAGNAGLFATALDVLSFGGAYLSGGAGKAGRALSRSSVAAATTDRTPGCAEHRGLGWKLNGPEGALCDLASSEAYGHTGFTGAAMLIDPARELVAVLLAGRLQLGRANERILRVRRLFFNAVLGALE